MAQKAEHLRILGGGLMLIPPADLVPAPYAAAMQNFRVDRGGQIKTRRGLFADGTGIAGGKLHTLYRTGNDRYGGVGGALKLGPALATAVDSGYDGDPLGVASAFDWTWFMNRAQRRKVEGANASNWGIAAPASAPVAAVGALTSTLISQFDDTDAWEGVYFADNAEQIEPSFRVTHYSTGTVQVTNGSTLATGVNVDWGPSGTDVQVGMDLVVDDGTTSYTLAISAIPTDNTLTIASFGGVTGEYSYIIQKQQAAKTYDAVNKQFGTHSTHLECNPAGRWSLRKNFTAADFGFAGEERDDDIFHFYLYASNSKSINSVTVTCYNGSGTARTSVQCTFLASILSGDPFHWNDLSIRRRLDPAAVVGASQRYQRALKDMADAQEQGNTVAYEAAVQAKDALYTEILSRTPYFQETATATNFDWSLVTGVRFEFDINEACDVHLDRADWWGSGGALSGEFTFFYTYENDAGHESNPSDPSEAIVVTKRKIDLSGIVNSPDGQVSNKHIYGIGGSLEAPKRFATIFNNTVTTITLDVSLDAVQDLNVDMPTQNGLPPAARGVVQHMGRLIAFDSDDFPARAWWTEVAKPYAFYGAPNDTAGNWRDNGEASERILTAKSRANMLLFYKQRSIWRHVGDIATGVPERAAAKMGPVGSQAVAQGTTADYLATEEGIYRFNGDSGTEISGQLKPLFQSEQVELPGGYVIQPWNRAQASKCVMEFSNGRLYFSYPEAGQTENTATLVYDEATEVWAVYRNGPSVGFGGFSALFHEGTGNGLIGGVTGGGGAAVYEVELGANDGGGTIPVLYQTAEHDMGAPDLDKRLSEIGVEYRTAEQGQTPAAITLKAISAAGVTTPIGSLVSATPTRGVWQVGTLGEGLLSRGWSVQFEGSVAATCTITAIDLYYIVEARSRMAFDSDVLNFCYMQKMESFDVELTSSGVVNWSVFSDASGVLASVATGSFTSTAGARKPIPVALTDVTGKHFRLRLWSTGATFQIHDLRVKLRELGEFVDGTLGGFFETTDKALGDLHEKAWLFRRFSVDLDTTGAMALKWYTELHARNMALKQTNAVNSEITTTGRRTIEAGLPGNMKGFLKRVRFDGANKGFLYGLKVYAKPLGWGDGQWVWVDIPMRKEADIASCVEVPVA